MWRAQKPHRPDGSRNARAFVPFRAAEDARKNFPLCNCPERCVETPRSEILNPLAQLTRSSIGKKWIVALTGLVMFLFVVGHMIGNLQLFLGPEAINNYGALLRTSPELLWIVRLVLLSALVLHVIFTMWIVIENRRARPVQYEKKASVQSKLSTRLMAITGLLLLAFVIFHLLHFTSHSVDPSFAGFHDEKGRHDVFRMVIVGFENRLHAGFYAVAMVMLCSHLSHGAWSWLQTVGLRSKKVAEPTTRGAWLIALALAAGYLSIPFAVQFTKFGRGYVAEREHAGQMTAPTAPQISPAK